MSEMLKTSHLSVLMGRGEPPPTASTYELVNVLHMWVLLMQFRVSPKAWVITCSQTAGPLPSSVQRSLFICKANGFHNWPWQKPR